MNTPKYITITRYARGFTLVEMLVVIAIISILASMLAPSLQNALNQSRMIYCTNNLKQMYIGLSGYAEKYNGFTCPTDGHLYTSHRWWDWWLGMNYYDYPVVGPSQTPPSNKSWEGFRCPEDSEPRSATFPNRTYAVMRVLMGRQGTTLGDMQGMRYAEIPKPSRSYFFGEVEPVGTHVQNCVILAGSTAHVIAMNGYELFPYHNGNTNILFLDGHAGARNNWLDLNYYKLDNITE